MWLQTAFAIPESAMRLDANTLSAAFTSLRDGKPMVIEMAADGRMTVATESMEAAGEVVQEIAAYLQMTELESVANFPAEMAAFEEVLAAVDEFNQTRLKLTAEMADSSNLLKSLVIKAEVTTTPTPHIYRRSRVTLAYMPPFGPAVDRYRVVQDSRILGEMGRMQEIYANLFDLNRDLILEHTKRTTNHTQLLAALKNVSKHSPLLLRVILVLGLVQLWLKCN